MPPKTPTTWTAPPVDRPGGSLVAPPGLVEEWSLADRAVAGRRRHLDAVFASGRDPFSLRFVYLHLIGEYARHNGHADLVREQVDGVTGA